MKSYFIKSPINYIGNKYKIISQIIPLFPQKIKTFVDVLGGSGTVLLNVSANQYVYNDINPYVASIFNGLVFQDCEEIISQMENIISEYKLSKTNKEGFEKLREDYNNGKNDWLTLYTLMCYSFNYQFRFNNIHQYNSSFGKNRSCFSDNQRKNIRAIRTVIGNKAVSVSAKNFIDLDYSEYANDDLVYFDPPYLNSTGSYNDGKRGFEGWTEQHENQLLQLLDDLDNRGVGFALSNNLKYGNPLLEQWRSKYKTNYLYGDYSNCNYHKIDRSKDIEVLITNY